MAFTYSKLAEVTVGSGGSPSIGFTNIPQNYNDLVIKVSLRTDNNSSNYLSAFITFNGSTSGYSQRMVYGTGSSALSASGSGTYIDWAAYGTATPATANTFGNGEIYIPNYTGSTNKSISSDSVSENNATNSIAALTAGLWSNTTAISRITLAGNSGNLAQYSTATLYGVKAEV